jgi:hypothetical protein
MQTYFSITQKKILVTLKKKEKNSGYSTSKFWEETYLKVALITTWPLVFIKFKAIGLLFNLGGTLFKKILPRKK